MSSNHNIATYTFQQTPTESFSFHFECWIPGPQYLHSGEKHIIIQIKEQQTQEKQAANTCTVHIIYGPVYAYTTGKIRVPVSVTMGPSIPVMAQFYHGNYRISIVYNVEDVTMCARICDRR